MSNLIEASIRNILRPATKQLGGLSVTFHSNALDKSFTVTATRGSTSGEAETADGIVFTHDLFDFKIDVDDLVDTDGAMVKPQHLDLIEVDIPGTTGWFQVVNDGNQKHTEQMDNWGAVWHIRCKVVPPPVIAQAVVVYGRSTGEAFGTPSGAAYGPPTP